MEATVAPFRCEYSCNIRDSRWSYDSALICGSLGSSYDSIPSTILVLNNLDLVQQALRQLLFLHDTELQHITPKE